MLNLEGRLRIMRNANSKSMKIEECYTMVTTLIPSKSYSSFLKCLYNLRNNGGHEQTLPILIDNLACGSDHRSIDSKQIMED